MPPQQRAQVRPLLTLAIDAGQSKGMMIVVPLTPPLKHPSRPRKAPSHNARTAKTKSCTSPGSLAPPAPLRRLLLPLPLLWGCGDPLRDALYRGEPLLTLSGEILVQRELNEGAAQLRVAIYWMSQGSEVLQQQPDEMAIDTAFPALYALSLFLPPPESVRSPDEHPLAIGFPMLYLDTDGDDTWAVGEEAVVGGTTNTHLLFTEDGFFSREGEQTLDAGYLAVRFDACPADAAHPTAPIPVEPSSADLRISPTFLEALVDIDCDGSLQEWEGLCEGGCLTE